MSAELQGLFNQALSRQQADGLLTFAVAIEDRILKWHTRSGPVVQLHLAPLKVTVQGYTYSGLASGVRVALWTIREIGSKEESAQMSVCKLLTELRARIRKG